jgi:hypothetical protein
LPKSGTSTVVEALRALGFSTLTNPYDRNRVGHLLDGDVSLPAAHWPYDVLWDVPVFAWWREIVDAHPDTKLILTCREQEPWMDSVRRHFARARLNRDKRTALTERLHKSGQRITKAKAFAVDVLAGRGEWTNAELIALSNEHDVEVATHALSSRWPCVPLILWPCDGSDADAQWRELAEFVGREPPVTGTPWPWMNRGKEAVL